MHIYTYICTSLAPSPMNIWTSCGPASFRKHALVCAAQARAMSVLPVPGGPYLNKPLRYFVMGIF